jgi:hypothetical protein
VQSYQKKHSKKTFFAPGTFIFYSGFSIYFNTPSLEQEDRLQWAYTVYPKNRISGHFLSTFATDINLN